MDRSELVEWVLLLLCIVLWWPRIFLPLLRIDFDPLWYHILIYYVVPLVVIAITVRRYRRMKTGLEYSQQVVDGQRGGPPNLRPPDVGDN